MNCNIWYELGFALLATAVMLACGAFAYQAKCALRASLEAASRKAKNKTISLHLLHPDGQADSTYRVSLPLGALVLGTHDLTSVCGDREVWSYLVVRSNPDETEMEVREFISLRHSQALPAPDLEYVGTFGRPICAL